MSVWKRTKVQALLHEEVQNVTHQGNGKAVHGDMLKPSNPNYKDLAEEVGQQFLTVCELYGRENGGKPFPVPKTLEGHFLRWRQMLLRHRKGDFRNSPSEWASTKEVAQFVFEWHCRLRGQPVKVLVWSE